VNDATEVVGGAGNQNDQAFLAFLWKNGVMTNLGTADGDPCSQANMINSKSQIVGISGTCDFFTVQHAFIWEKGQMTDLNSVVGEGSGLRLLDALEINDRGEIIGQGALANGDQHVFLLIPCDDDHSDEGGCGHAAGNATAAIENTPALARQNPVDATRLHARFGRNRGLATMLPK
jgi:probable HAF family extracellular repeat protein